MKFFNAGKRPLAVLVFTGALLTFGYAPPHAHTQHVKHDPTHQATTFKLSKKYKKNGISVVALKGSPYEIGLAHGHLCKDEIITVNHPFFDLYDQFAADKNNRWLALSRRLQDYIPQEYLEEMRGISDGSGIEYKKILFINTLSTISESKKCFAFAFVDDRSEIVTMRQVDIGSRAPLYKDMILYMVKPERGYGFAAILNPGWVDGESGINENGLTVSQNNIGIAQTDWDVMPITHLSRHMLQYSATIDDAENLLEKQKALPARLLFLSSRNGASFFEIANKEKSRTDMEHGYLALANHACSIPSRRLRMSSAKRLDHANAYLAENDGKMDIDKALKLVRSSRISWRWNFGVHNRQSFIFSPSGLNLWIAIPPRLTFLPASYGPYVGFNLLKELYGKGDEPTPESFPAH